MLLLLACLLTGAAEGDKTLEGGVWSLVELNGEVVQLPAAERQPYLQFQRQDGRVKGYSGCNDLFGSYELKGETLIFGPLGMTRRFCAGKAGEVEQALLGVLAKVNIWRIEDRVLLLVAGDRVLARLRQEQRDTRH